MSLGAGVPESVGGYRLEDRLGAGGMGVVYLARSVSGRKYAVKLIRAEHATDPEFRSRFRREVAAAQRVSGAFTAPVVDADPDGDPPWLATLFVPGPSLTRRVERSGRIREVRELAVFAGQLAEALRAVHRAGLVHRDLKPDNILLAEDGPRVIDFGITRAVTDSRRLTRTGDSLGTPPFMAPEQFRAGDPGIEVTAAADVFALGAVVAFAAMGRSPFEGGPGEGSDPLIVAYRVVYEEPRLDGLPPELAALVTSCLDKDPARRPSLDAVERLAAEAAGTPPDQATVAFRIPAPDRTPTELDSSGTGAARGGQAPVGPHPALLHGLPTAPAPYRTESPDPATPVAPTDASRNPKRTRRRWIAAAATAVAVAAVGTGLSLWGSSLWEGPPGGSKGKEAAKKPTPAWETDLAELGVPNAMESGFSCTATSDRDLLCQDGGRLVLKLNPANGKILWSYDRPATTEVSVGVEEFDGKVYTQARETADGDGDGIVALDLATGKVERRFEVPDLRDGFVATDSGVLVQSGPKELWLLNAKNPRPLARWKAGDDEIESIASNGKSVVMTVSSHEDDRAFAHISLEATDSSLSEHLAYAFAEGAPDAPRPPLRPIGAGTSTLYFAEGGSGPADEYVAVDRTDPETGIDLWKRIPLKSPTDLPMTVADDFAYAPSSNGMITAVDCRRDRIAWHKDSGARGISQLAVREGKIFLTDAQGRLHTLDALTGRHLSMGKPHRGSRDADSRNDPPPPVLIGDAAYVITPGNTLYRTPLPTRK